MNFFCVNFSVYIINIRIHSRDSQLSFNFEFKKNINKKIVSLKVFVPLHLYRRIWLKIFAEQIIRTRQQMLLHLLLKSFRRYLAFQYLHGFFFWEPLPNFSDFFFFFFLNFFKWLAQKWCLTLRFDLAWSLENQRPVA